MRCSDKGFSFFGFVIVLALIAFLLMVAIPQYLEYRDHVGENSNLSSPAADPPFFIAGIPPCSPST
ncbi:hypothetical protein [Desulfonatronospira sp.]|uniref:hypothetical protein n=1 Tax=Desulfonatronospira sp. TaxID=1962951 RepID=UPI0025BA2123|nr:hypothetical protein [Desulfonatronospira sp.]